METEWALVADAQRARILQRKIHAEGWRELPGETIEITNPRSHERGTERPGRVGESAGAARHAIEPRTDLHREAKRAFAQRLAERLEQRAAEYQRLMLIAPPAFLGDLRAALGEAARRKLHATLDKDLTHLALLDLAPRLDEVRPD